MNVDTSLASTDENIMKMYASLVEDKNVTDTIMGMILKELELTREMIQLIFKKPLDKRRTLHFNSNQIRAKALEDLHKYQVGLLKKWRQAKKEENEKVIKDLELKLLVSVNAIASALRNTG
jgi:phosphoenolpyruvate carboxylase